MSINERRTGWLPYLFATDSLDTAIGAGFFHTYRDLRDFTSATSGGETIEELLEAKTNGLEFWLEYNNTDFPRNPSRAAVSY